MQKPSRHSRRSWLQTNLACAGLAGSAWLERGPLWAQDQPKPSALTITKVETFALKHKLPKAIGPSTILYGFRDALLIKISTDSGLVGWGETADVGGTRGHGLGVEVREDVVQKYLVREQFAA